GCMIHLAGLPSRTLAQVPSVSEKKEDLLRERMVLDQRFRLVVSWSSFLAAAVLAILGVLTSATPIFLVVMAYNIPYLTVWFFLDRIQKLRACALLLSVLDFAAI